MHFSSDFKVAEISLSEQNFLNFSDYLKHSRPPNLDMVFTGERRWLLCLHGQQKYDYWLIINKTINKLLIVNSIHIPIYMLQSVVWYMPRETHAHPKSYIQYSQGDLTWNQKSNDNTTAEHAATVSPFEFLFLNFSKTSLYALLSKHLTWR